MYYKLKPLRDYSEHDVIPFFSLVEPNAPLGLLVTITGSGFVNGQAHGISHNLNANQPNVFTPRWEVKAKVTACPAGQMPLGFTLYEVKENGGFYNKPLMYDSAARWDGQYVISGEGVPICRKGLFLVNIPGTGAAAPKPGMVTVAGPTGEWAAAADGTANAFGKILGAPDADGYTLVAVDFNK